MKIIILFVLMAVCIAAGYRHKIPLWKKFLDWFGDEHLSTVRFKGCNGERTAPSDHPEVATLHVHYDGSQNISRWKLSWKGRWRALVYGDVWLGVMGFTLPPMWISTMDMTKHIVICPCCERRPENPGEKKKYYRIMFSGNNVYNCGCGAIFIRRDNGVTKLMADPDGTPEQKERHLRKLSNLWHARRPRPSIRSQGVPPNARPPAPKQPEANQSVSTP
jgi:hypothetical protein